MVIDGASISHQYYLKICDFVNEHKMTNFDQFVDYPSPIYRFVWKGKEFVSREMQWIVERIIIKDINGV